MRRENRATVDLLVAMEPLAILVTRALKVLLVHLVLQELLVQLVHLVHLVVLANLDPRDLKDRLDHRVQLVPLVTLVHLVHLVPLVTKEAREKLVQLVKVVNKVHRVQLDNQVMLVRREIEEQMELQDPKALLAPKEHEDWWEHQVHKEIKEIKDPRENPVQLVSKATPEWLVILERREIMEQWEILVSREFGDHQVLLVYLVFQVVLALLEPQVSPGIPVLLVQLVPRVSLVLVDKVVTKEKWERKETEVLWVQLVPKEPEDHLV